MSVANKLKTVVKRTSPPVVLGALQGANRVLKYRPVKEKKCSLSKGVDILSRAKNHLAKAASALITEMPPSKRWTQYLMRIRADIDKITNPRDAVFYAQKRVGFDHREPASAQRSYYKLYEDTVKSEFPHFSDVIEEMGDSPFSIEDTLVRYGRRLVSNIFYCHLRNVLLCLSYVQAPEIVCEIGGGYGGPARLWLQNPIHRPGTYVLVDFPESLFFAEVFLRLNFDDLELMYMTDPASLDADAASKQTVILCPIQCVQGLSGLSLDLVVNTGSIQEMTDEWVDFWMKWLRKQDCRYFYSVNCFAQPLVFMAEAANAWSPRLTQEWDARLLRFNPPFLKQQSNRNFAEILAEKTFDKCSMSTETLKTRYELLRGRVLDGQTLLEAMDIVRTSPDEQIMWDLLQRCISEMRTMPKEAYYLAEQLTKNATAEFQARNGEQLCSARSTLSQLRSGGKEDMISH